MGYTVFFEQSRAFTMQEWGDIRAACIPMFNRLKQIKGPSGIGRPEISNTGICFNGDASKGEDHETFIIEREGNGFQFCKTARKPYDRFVKAVLVIANYYAPGALKVSCDGDDEPDCWTEGVSTATIYANGVPGRSPCSPLELKEPFKDGNLLDGKSPSEWIQDAKAKGDKNFQIASKACSNVNGKFTHENVYEGHYTEIDEAIELWVKLTKGNKVHTFLANYLKANIEDIKDVYTP